jgi:D-arginine utilization repressor
MSKGPEPAHPHQPVADAIAALFAPWVEVAIHDIASDSLAYVASPMSPRTPGDPSGLADLGSPSTAGFIGPYEKTNWDGRRIRSVSVMLAGEPASMLCINADVSRFEAMREMLDMLLKPARPAAQAEAAPLLRHDWHESLNRFIAGWSAERQLDARSLGREERQALIAAIHESGGFEAPRAAAYVAGLLNVSRATVYNQLAELKRKALAA